MGDRAWVIVETHTGGVERIAGRFCSFVEATRALEAYEPDDIENWNPVLAVLDSNGEPYYEY